MSTLAARAPLAGRRILVVDDQPSIRGVLEVALTEAGADVWSAADGPEALETIASSTPDLILLDLAMPGMNGWQVIEELTAKPRTAAIPVVLQTSAEDFGSFERARKQGVAAFISKPFRLNEVVETCRRIFEGARPLQGRSKASDESPVARLHDDRGNLLAVGRLLDRGPRGAQVELESPLRLALRVALTVHEAAGAVTLQAEVRWVTRVGERFHHGLLILAD